MPEDRGINRIISEGCSSQTGIEGVGAMALISA